MLKPIPIFIHLTPVATPMLMSRCDFEHILNDSNTKLGYYPTPTVGRLETQMLSLGTHPSPPHPPL